MNLSLCLCLATQDEEARQCDAALNIDESGHNQDISNGRRLARVVQLPLRGGKRGQAIAAYDQAKQLILGLINLRWAETFRAARVASTASL